MKHVTPFLVGVLSILPVIAGAADSSFNKALELSGILSLSAPTSVQIDYIGVITRPTLAENVIQERIDKTVSETVARSGGDLTPEREQHLRLNIRKGILRNLNVQTVNRIYAQEKDYRRDRIPVREDTPLVFDEDAVEEHYINYFSKDQHRNINHGLKHVGIQPGGKGWKEEDLKGLLGYGSGGMGQLLVAIFGDKDSTTGTITPSPTKIRDAVGDTNTGAIDARFAKFDDETHLNLYLRESDHRLATFKYTMEQGRLKLLHMTYYHPSSAPQLVVDYSQHKPYGDMQVMTPHRQILTEYDEHGDQLLSTEYTILNVKFPRFIDEEIFDMPFPIGYYIMDSVAGMNYRMVDPNSVIDLDSINLQAETAQEEVPLSETPLVVAKPEAVGTVITPQAEESPKFGIERPRQFLLLVVFIILIGIRYGMSRRNKAS